MDALGCLHPLSPSASSECEKQAHHRDISLEKLLRAMEPPIRRSRTSAALIPKPASLRERRPELVCSSLEDAECPVADNNAEVNQFADFVSFPSPYYYNFADASRLSLLHASNLIHGTCRI